MLDNALYPNVQNEQINKALQESIKEIFPITNQGKKMILTDIHVTDTLDDNDFPAQKDAKISRKSWHNPIIASFNIVDEKSGRLIHKASNIKIGNIPKLTNRFTTIIDGNEYQTNHQIRRKSGIYSRIKKNGELESEFNLSKGRNFKMNLDPESQVFNIYFENRKYRVWTLLNLLGMDDKTIESVWGKELLDINKKGALNTEVSEMSSIYEKLFKKVPKDFNEVINGIKSYFSNFTEVSSETTKVTLGESFDKVTPEALLAASKNLLNINRGLRQPDDRDSLIFKQIYSVDDLLHAYFKNQTPIIKKKLERTLGLKDKVREIVTSATFADPIKKFFTTGDLTSPPVQTNPVTIADEARKTTPMGTGGIGSSHAITMEARAVQPTHFGFLDPLNTPESQKIGIKVGLASEVKKVGNDIATPVVDNSGKISWLNPTQFFDLKIGFPDQFEYKGNTVNPRYPFINVMHKGVTKKVPKSEVDYYLRSPQTMFSLPQNLIPFMPNNQANRANMAYRMYTQALPIDQKEKPLVRVARDKNSTYEDLLGSYLNPEAPSDGTISKIDENYIYIKPEGKKDNIKIGLYKDFPLNQDGYLNSKVLVQEGQKVKKDQILTENNYSIDRTLSLGKNLNVAYMSYKGYTFEDGIVITDSAAKKLSHTMLHRLTASYNPKLSAFNKKKFLAWYPEEVIPSNLQKLDERGIIKPGSEILPGEVVCAFLVEKELDDVERILKRLDKYVFSNYTKNITIWENEDVGVVTEVKDNGNAIDIYIKSVHPLKIGDKLSGRYGNKGVVTQIISAEEAPQRLNGDPIDILLSPEGVPGRMNIGQILETAASKIAEKKGSPYIINNFSEPDTDWSNKINQELIDNNIEANEVLIDGKTKKPIKNPIFVGKQYILKLRHIVDKKEGAHNYGVYDINEQPAGAGTQHTGSMELSSYLAHGAKANLFEHTAIKGRKNEEYWRNLQFGLTPSKPNRNFIFEKMIAYLKGAGINTEKKDNLLQIFPQTDKDVTNMSNGHLTDPGAMLVGKNLSSREGGLFDKKVTGGLSGKNWSHIDLVERIPNPIYKDPIIKLLDLTENGYEDILAGKKELNDKTGMSAILKSLSEINVVGTINKLKKELKTTAPTKVNKLNTTIKYLENLKAHNLTPTEAYTISKIPVIPPVFRPVYPLPSGDLIVNDLNKHYRDVGLMNAGLKGISKELTTEDKNQSMYNLYNTVSALQGLIEPITYSKDKYKGILTEMAEMKTGLIQGPAMQKPQDISGRSVIVVEPDLGIDEMGIPKDMAYNIMKPFVIRDMIQSGIKATNALQYYNEKNKTAEKSLQNVLRTRPVVLNRAPSLHKFSVMGFKPTLVSGKSIKINPLIVKGFTADFDGDTMSLMVPVGTDAQEEARQMYPSNHLFSHGSKKLMTDLSKDFIYGLYELSLINKKTSKSFSNVEEAKSSKLDWTTECKIGGKTTTIGQYYINAVLPTDMQDYTRTLDKKAVDQILTNIGIKYPNLFSQVINAWKNLGSEYAYLVGHTISITDLAVDRKDRDKALKSELAKAKTSDEIIKATMKVTAEEFENLKKKLPKDNNLKLMLDSGSFGKVDQARQMILMPGILTGFDNKPMAMPIAKSWSEGLDTMNYWNTQYNARKNAADRAIGTQETGAFNKSLLNVTRKLLVTEIDCGTKEGIEFLLDDKNVIDRCLLETVLGVGKRNDVVDSNLMATARSKNIKSLKVRSPLTCETVEGICQKCYGLMPNGQLPQIGTNVGALDGQAVTESAVQGGLHSFHGGSALAKGGVISSFERVNQLFRVPEKLSNKATLAENSGIVKEITKNPIGGYNVTINSKQHIIPPGLLPTIKLNDEIQKGQALSEGILKPQELGSLTDHLTAQKYLVDQAAGIYTSFYKKNLETVFRGVSDNAKIVNAPDDSGYLRGDLTSISRLKYLNKQRKKENLPIIEYKPYFKSTDTLNTDSSDWLTRVTTNRIKDGLTIGAAKGLYTNLKGKDPIPAYIFGDEFGKNLDYQKGRFY